jgi:phosphatidylserine/phosphatidylglycerophosphate/cardiolipin synthase-like enzyme
MINSYSIDIEYHIIKHLQQAENKLLIAVAWFTNNRIGNEILQLKNVETEIVVDDNPINRKSSILRELESKNISITYIKDKEKQHYLMHNKFCVIDLST